MEPQKITGPNAGVLKYDILTALTVAALSGPQTLQTSFLRLIGLITARYDWSRDELRVGQRDMARMWSVNERTVKREIKRLTQLGVLVCKRQGVRGRVGAYRLDQAQIANLSKSSWPLVGPDFQARMDERYAAPQAKVVALKDYAQPSGAKYEPKNAGTWQAAVFRIATEEPSLARAWFGKLEFVSFDKGCLRLRAPSPFVQRYIETHHMGLMLRHVESELGVVDRVEFEI